MSIKSSPKSSISHHKISRLISFIQNASPNKVIIKKSRSNQQKNAFSLSTNKKIKRANQVVDQFLEKKGIIHGHDSKNSVHKLGMNKQSKYPFDNRKKSEQNCQKLSFLPSIQKKQKSSFPQKFSTLPTETPDKKIELPYQQSFLLSRAKYFKQKKNHNYNISSNYLIRDLQKQTKTQKIKKNLQSFNTKINQEIYNGWEVNTDKDIPEQQLNIWVRR